MSCCVKIMNKTMNYWVSRLKDSKNAKWIHCFRFCFAVIVGLAFGGRLLGRVKILLSSLAFMFHWNVFVEQMTKVHEESGRSKCSTFQLPSRPFAPSLTNLVSSQVTLASLVFKNHISRGYKFVHMLYSTSAYRFWGR